MPKTEQPATSPTAPTGAKTPQRKGKKPDSRASPINTTDTTGACGALDPKLAGKLKDRLKLLIQRSGNPSVLGVSSSPHQNSSGNSAGVLDLSRLGLEHNPPAHQGTGTDHQNNNTSTTAAAKVPTTLELVFGEIAANPAIAAATSTVTFASNASIGPLGIAKLLRQLLPEALPNITCLDLCQVGFSDLCVPDLLAALGYVVSSSSPHSTLGGGFGVGGTTIPISRTLRLCTKIKLGDNELTAIGVRKLVDGLLSANVDIEWNNGSGTTPGSNVNHHYHQHRSTSGNSMPSLPATPPQQQLTKHGLVQIHLGGNKIADEGVAALADLFGNHLGQLGDSMLPHRIEYLGLRSVHVGAMGISALASRLLLNSTLAELQLRHNPLIRDSGISAFAVALRTMSGLTHLDLKEVGMTEGGLSLLAAAVKQSPSKLRSLCLSNNDFSPPTPNETSSPSSLLPFQALGDALCASPSLTVLNLDSCHLNSQTAALIFKPLSELIHREITPATLMNLAANRPVVGNLHSRTTPPTVSIDHHCLSTLTLNDNDLCLHSVMKDLGSNIPTFKPFVQVMKGLLSAEPKRLGLLSVEMARCNLSSRCCSTVLDAISMEPVPGFKSALKHLDISSNFLGVPTCSSSCERSSDLNNGATSVPSAPTAMFPPHEVPAVRSSLTTSAGSLQGFPGADTTTRAAVSSTPPPFTTMNGMMNQHIGSPTGQAPSSNQQIYVPVAFVPAGPAVATNQVRSQESLGVGAIPMAVPMQTQMVNPPPGSTSTTFLQLQRQGSTGLGTAADSRNATPTLEHKHLEQKNVSCGTLKLAEVLRNNRSLIRFMINDNELPSQSMEILCKSLEGTHSADSTTPPSNIRYLVFGGQSKTHPLANEVSDELRARMNAVIDKNKQHHSAVVAQGRSERAHHNSSSHNNLSNNASFTTKAKLDSTVNSSTSLQMSPQVWSVENFTNYSNNTTPNRGWNTVTYEPIGGSLADELALAHGSQQYSNLTGCSLNSVGSGIQAAPAPPPQIQSGGGPSGFVQEGSMEFITSPFHVPTLQVAASPTKD